MKYCDIVHQGVPKSSQATAVLGAQFENLTWSLTYLSIREHFWCRTDAIFYFNLLFKLLSRNCETEVVQSLPHFKYSMESCQWEIAATNIVPAVPVTFTIHRIIRWMVKVTGTAGTILVVAAISHWHSNLPTSVCCPATVLLWVDN